jgi:hypothetical protein
MKMGKRIFAGNDLGAATAKIVIFGDKQLLGYSIIPTQGP